MKFLEGSKIIAYGQKVVITQVMKIKNKTIIYLEHHIVVLNIEYTRDYIYPNEIQKVINL